MTDGATRARRNADTFAMLSGLLATAAASPAERRAPDGSLPLTVISGFLGAGKTTLLNHLLQEPGGRRLAVLVNDFGAVNVDAALVSSRTASAIELSNGCACCSVAGDLSRAIAELSRRPNPPDAIVLEASGIADPRAIVQVALAHPSLRFDGIVTLVDAEGFGSASERPSDRDLVADQIGAADIVALNKTDLVSGERLARVRSGLAGLTTAPVVETRRAVLPAAAILGLNAVRPPEVSCFAERHDGFRNWSGSWTRPLRRDALLAALAALPGEVIRAKGSFALEGQAARLVYQRVGRRAAFDEAPARSDPSAFVAIWPAEALDAEAIARSMSGLETE